MTPDNFEKLLGCIKVDILKEDTHIRESIPFEIRLVLTIIFQIGGNSYQGVSMCFRVHKLTVAKFIQEFVSDVLRD